MLRQYVRSVITLTRDYQIPPLLHGDRFQKQIFCWCNGPAHNHLQFDDFSFRLRFESNWQGTWALAKLGLEGNTVTRKQVANVLVDKLAATRAKRTTKVPLDETDVEFDDDQIDEALSDVRDEAHLNAGRATQGKYL